MSQSTPGRRRNDPKHAKYNPDPKNVGTYSGKPMPSGVPRLSNGMEDPDGFFQSSPNAPDSGRTGRTTRPDTEPPSSGRSRKGRMSQLENEGSGDETFAQDLLQDDDFPNDGSPAPVAKKTTSANLASGSQTRPRTPSAGNPSNPSPSSGSPRTYARNRANNSTSTARKASTIGVGYRPSLVGQASTIGVGVGVGGSPASRKTATTGAAPTRPVPEEMNGEMDMDIDLDELDMEMDDTRAADTTAPAEDEEEEEETPAKKKSKAGKGKGKGAEEEEEESRTPAAGRKGRRDPDEEEEEEDMGGEDEPELGQEEEEEEAAMTRSEMIQKGKMAAKKQREKVAAAEAEEEEPEVENQEEDGPAEEEDVDDNGGGFDGPEEEEDEAALEQAAMDAEENGGSGQEEEMEDEEAEPAPVPKRGRPKAAPREKVATTAGTGGRKKRDANGKVIVTKKRISRLGEDGGEGDGIHGDFQTRKSRRQHIAPLRGWMNEKFEYTKGPHGTIIKSVVRMPEEPVVPFAATRHAQKSKKRARSQSARPQNGPVATAVWVPPEAGWDDMTVPLGKVIDFETGVETERRVVYPARLLNPKVVDAEGSFRYQKVFGDDVYMASGILELPANHGFKPEKSSKDNTYTFYVVAGAVNMKIHKTSYILAPGGMSMVPRGNKYSIENVSPNDAVLFFSQARKIRMREDEDAANEAAQLSQSQRSAGGPAKRKRGSLKAVQEEEPEEEEEGSQEEEEEEVVRRPVAKGKKRGKAR